MISESWEDTIQPLLTPGSEVTIEFGVRFLEEREDGLEEESYWRLPNQRTD
jgi:hypothetical protein